VLRALGVGTELAHSSIRFGLGRFNTEDEVDFTIKRVVEEVHRLRALSPVYKTMKAKMQNRRQAEINLRQRVS
jgi:cysteine desulfurase